VDRIFSRPNEEESKRRKNLRRVFTYIFASMFVLVNGVQANALQFGLQVILASSYGREKSNNEQLDKFLAIVIITFVCQLHSYSRSIYINIANVLAIIKASSLAFISICGFLALGGFRMSSGQEHFSAKYGMQNLKLDFDSKSNNLFEYALALLSVIRAFQGYENANFVSVSPGNEHYTSFHCSQSSLGP
jgi:L-asparagine transporter-like permease